MFNGHLLQKVAVCVHDMPQERSRFFKCINNQNTSQQRTGSEKGRITVGGILTGKPKISRRGSIWVGSCKARYTSVVILLLKAFYVNYLIWCNGPLDIDKAGIILILKMGKPSLLEAPGFTQGHELVDGLVGIRIQGFGLLWYDSKGI